MASWDLLDEKAETELHKARLLNVEEKPFKRITKRVSTITSILSKLADKDAAAAPPSNSSSNSSSKLDQLQEDLTLDFAAFDSSIARLQFLHDANERERARYDEDKQRILGECGAVRERNAALRRQLEGARAKLAQRKKFDELADRITSNRLLRPREDQLVNLAKLEDECRELERESETYTATWRERRDQFNRIMDEGMMLRRQIRDEKEEVDRREGMNEGEGDEDDQAVAVAVAAAAAAAAPVTPQPPEPEVNGSATPQPHLDGGRAKEADKAEDDDDADDDDALAAGTPSADYLQVPGVASDGASKSASRVVSAAASPHLEREDSEDVEMKGGDAAAQAVSAMDTPEPDTEKMEVDD